MSKPYATIPAVSIICFNKPANSCNGNLSQTAKEAIVPKSAIISFRTDYEEPTLAEGFREIKLAYWKFEGEEDQLRRWQMWLE
jgi:hypothetical protein